MRLENISRREFLKDIGGLVLFSAIPNSAQAVPNNPYSVQKVGSEYRLFREGGQNKNRHFMSVVTEDNYGKIFCIRPHPDGLQDDNAWDSSLYLQPFLPDATLKNTIISEPIIDNESDSSVNGITISASGKVSRGTSQTFGTWNLSMKFSYISDYRIECNTAGKYSITLDDKLSDLTGDLNLFKIASNFLIDVPLRSGGNGNTGNMSLANIYFNDKLKKTWIPTQGTSYPSNSTNNLAMDLIGCYNNVDTLAQGHPFRIEPAYKPNMRVKIERRTIDEVRTKMILGTAYDENKKQDPFADNVSITPLILKSAPEKIFNFDVWFESTPFRKNNVENSHLYK